MEFVGQAYYQRSEHPPFCTRLLEVIVDIVDLLEKVQQATKVAGGTVGAQNQIHVHTTLRQLSELLQIHAFYCFLHPHGLKRFLPKLASIQVGTIGTHID